MKKGICTLCGKETVGKIHGRVLQLCPECRAERDKIRKKGEKVPPLPPVYVCRRCKGAFPASCFIKRDEPVGKYARGQYSYRCKSCIAEIEQQKKVIAEVKAEEREIERQRVLLRAESKKKLKAEKKAIETEVGHELTDERYREIKAERAWTRINDKAAMAKAAGMSYGKYVAWLRHQEAKAL